MLDLYFGARLLWSPRYLVIILTLTIIVLGFLRVIAPAAFLRFGYLRILWGYLAMVGGAFSLISLAMANNFYDAMAAMAIALLLTLICLTLVVLPIITFLQAIGRCSAVWAISLGTSISLFLLLIWELSIGPEVSNGFARWIAEVPYLLLIVGGGFAFFCLGARMNFTSTTDK